MNSFWKFPPNIFTAHLTTETETRETETWVRVGYYIFFTFIIPISGTMFGK